MSAPRTPSQTVGPFFGFCLTWPMGPRLVPPGTPGAIHVTGRLLDGDGAPVADGLIETWQAGPDGVYPTRGTAGDAKPVPSSSAAASAAAAAAASSSVFWGFGRSGTDAQGRYEIWTLKPGAVHAAGGKIHAPHIAMSVFARGLLRRLVTRMYFPDQGAANASDPVLRAITDGAARASLIAARSDDGYLFDIRLQREGETVFFDV